MVFGLKEDTVDATLVIIASILLFNTIPKFPWFGQYFEKWPYLFIVLAIFILLKRKSIARTLGH